jgi:polyhydroxyalkanoate synthesis regulator phasin
MTDYADLLQHANDIVKETRKRFDAQIVPFIAQTSSEIIDILERQSSAIRALQDRVRKLEIQIQNLEKELEIGEE